MLHFLKWWRGSILISSKKFVPLYNKNSTCTDLTVWTADLSISRTRKKKSNFQNQSIVNQHKSLKKFPYNTFLSPLWFPFGFWHCHLKNNITAIEGCPLHPAHHVLLLANISQDLLTVCRFLCVWHLLHSISCPEQLSPKLI